MEDKEENFLKSQTQYRHQSAETGSAQERDRQTWKNICCRVKQWRLVTAAGEKRKQMNTNRISA